MDRTAPLKGAGLLGTLGARASENTTSSALNGVPSWKRTPGRSLISQVSRCV